MWLKTATQKKPTPSKDTHYMLVKLQIYTPYLEELLNYFVRKGILMQSLCYHVFLLYCSFQVLL